MNNLPIKHYFQAFLGFLFYWRYLCLASAGYCLIVMFANCYLPESPYFVLLNSTIDDAKDELRKFRSRSYDINNELNQLQDFKHLNSIRRYISFGTGLYSAILLLFALDINLPMIYLLLYYIFITYILRKKSVLQTCFENRTRISCKRGMCSTI